MDNMNYSTTYVSKLENRIEEYENALKLAKIHGFHEQIRYYEAQIISLHRSLLTALEDEMVKTLPPLTEILTNGGIIHAVDKTTNRVYL